MNKTKNCTVMKKTKITLLLLMQFALITVWGQDKQSKSFPKHEFRLSIGSVTDDYYRPNYYSSYYGYYNSVNSLNPYYPTTYSDDKKTFGVIGLGYFYNFTKRLAVGGTLSYSTFNKNFYNRITDAKSGNSKEYNLGVTPSVRYSWLAKPRFKMYSGVGASLNMNVFKEKQDEYFGNNKTLSRDSQTSTELVLQITPLGMSFGGKVFGFWEVNLGGRTGLFTAGAGYRF